MVSNGENMNQKTVINVFMDNTIHGFVINTYESCSEYYELQFCVVLNGVLAL